MSAFYGTLEGQRSPVTRCGSKTSGIRAATQSWDGSVITRLYYSERDGHETLMVEVSTSNDSSAYGHRIWYGSFDEFEELLKRDTEEKRFQNSFNW